VHLPVANHQRLPHDISPNRQKFAGAQQNGRQY
jgi:hypothetical protein